MSIKENNSNININNKKVYAIAIDGPSAAGKSTLAKKVAKHFNFTYIDTGAMYRSVAYFATLKGIDLDDEVKVCSVLNEINIKLNNGKVYLNDEDVTTEIRKNEMSMGSSKVSKYHQVRLHMVELQRRMASESSVVMDGRDIGTYVLPDADIKLFLVANVNKRAHRRYLENIEKGIAGDEEMILNNLIKRDYDDSHRDFAPLRKADDAIEVDTSNLSIEETFLKVIAIIDSKIH